MAEKANKKYKDSVFVDLFYADESAEANEISLYNALHEEPLPEGTEIRKIRVENVLYMNFKNDISFDAGGKLIVFGEHQSTINENMPLRNLLYVGRAYEQLVPVEDRYKKKQVKLPKPEFYTFYNGEEAWAKEEVLKLSDAYLEQGGEKTLDLKVKMININPDQHHEILEKCPVLGEVQSVCRSSASSSEDRRRKCIAECGGRMYQAWNPLRISAEKRKRGGQYANS